MTAIRLITLDPAHFHAALVQKEMSAGIAPLTHVYAPLGLDLVAHLRHVAGFNTRPQKPTNWELEVHAGPDFLQRLLRERPEWRHIKIVMLSAKGRDAELAKGLALGADLYVTKPFSTSELVGRIEHLLA